MGSNTKEMSNRILTILLCLLDGILCFPQSPNQHIVQRGETLEIVARRYGMSADELKQANPWIGGCYTGLKLDIPEGKRKQDVLSGSEALAKAYIEKGKAIINANFCQTITHGMVSRVELYSVN